MMRTILMLMTAAPLFLACGDAKQKPADKPATDKPATDEADKPATDEPEAAPLDPEVAKAVAIADEISKDPSQADAILEKNGLDRDKLEAMMSDIAKDPEKANAYRIARAE